MIKKITLFLAVATFSSSVLLAQSFTALYSFDSVKAPSTNPIVIGSGLVDPTPVPTATGVTFGSFSAVGTSVNPNASKRFSFTSWPTGATTGVDLFSSLTGSINTSEYYEVTVTPVSGYTMTLSSITFTVERSGTGIRTYAVRSNADSYAANLPSSIAPSNANLSVQTGDIFFWNLDANSGSGQKGSTVTLSGTNFTNSISAKTFRFYGWNAEGTGGTFSIDTVKINGSVATTTTSISSFSTETAVSVYPNPSADGMFTVSTGNVSNKTIITVSNIIGKVVFTKELNLTGKETIDLSNEANGSYFVNIKNDKQNSTKKITINK
ncbi:MAG: T9SS type A sorting domain-containing protein [Bacteroidota bacterium]